MNKLVHILVALAVSALSGLIFLALAYLIIYNLAPPDDPAATGNLGLGQVLLALIFTVIYVILMTRYIYKKKRRRLKEVKSEARVNL